MLNREWDVVLTPILKSNFFINLLSKVNEEYQNKAIFPKYENIFNAFKKTDYSNVFVVIIGQDPYHGENEAHGLAFSVQKGIKMPPSLQNIFKELENDLGIKRTLTDLSDWTEQGVFLLNTILTVEKDKPLSHKSLGWEIFTDYVIKVLNSRKQPIVFVLWGNYAKSKKALITNKNHYIIESAHPSPLSASRGFFGSRPFSRINNILKNHYNKEIKW